MDSRSDREPADGQRRPLHALARSVNAAEPQWATVLIAAGVLLVMVGALLLAEII